MKLLILTPIVKMHINQVNIKNIMNAPWLRVPTQLLIQGQWWSKRSTHRLQIAQCRERIVRIILQSGHNSVGLKFYSNSRKSIG